MRIVCFLGPTLPVADAEAICPATYLAPARRGDVRAALAAHRPDAIALIDGYFEQVPSVWHKEILFALSEGVAVAGAASMGALRAAELAPFGMVGVGRVFEAYRSGRFAPFGDPFEDDDEVAVVHGPAEVAYAASDALVDIRATITAALDAGVIDLPCSLELLAAAKNLFYKDRTYPAVIELARAAGTGGATLDRFTRFLPEGRVRQKQRDAESLLARLGAGDITAPEPGFRFEPTLLWHTWTKTEGTAP